MSLIFLLPWFLLLYLSSKAKGYFLFYFVLFQFIFVGFGLSLFPVLGFGYLEKVFSAFDFSTLSAGDFNAASVVVLSGVAVTVLFYVTAVSLVHNERLQVSEENNVGDRDQHSFVSRNFLFGMMLLSIVICVPFVLENIRALTTIVFADTVNDLNNAVEFRRAATSGYWVVVFVYNILPAVSLIALLYMLDRPKISSVLIFVTFFLLSTLCLLLTYQKRPLLVFWGGCGLAAFLYGYLSQNIKKIKLKVLIFKMKWVILILLITLFIFYYFYTSYRFSARWTDLALSVIEVIHTRLTGRLSLPAAMYLNFFPDHHDFYGLSNVRLLTNIFGSETFFDSKEVFSYFSVDDIDGSVAASVFVDAYGQGGYLMPFLYGPVLAFLILFMEWLLEKSNAGVGRAFLVVAGLIFIYYLSQASLFRSLLGYGGIFYFLIWFFGIRTKVQSRLFGN